MPPHTMLTLDPGAVHVWHLLADDATDAHAVAALHTLLSDEERTRMETLGQANDRQLFLLSRGMMRTVLAGYLGCDCRDVGFSVNAYGKPIMQSSAAPLYFNLTHSRGAIALAVSAEREVGIDVEDRRRPVEYVALARRYFAAAEARHLEQLDAEQLRDAFFAIWTLKEAYVKGIGRGLTFPLDAFCFELDVDRLTAFRPLADFAPCDWQFHQFDLGVRHRGAVAAQGTREAEPTIELRDWASLFLPSSPAKEIT